MNKPRIVNIFAGPGTGKSTTATALFAELKYHGVNCEYVPEYAKDAAWEKRGKKFFQAQQLIYGQQSWRLERLRGEVSLMVTDCPLLMGLVYMPPEYEIPSLRNAIREDHARYESLNVYLTRNKVYNQSGRLQTETQARELDLKIRQMLDYLNIETLDLSFGKDNVSQIKDVLLRKGWI